MTTPCPQQLALAAVPDLPRWVEARGILLSGAAKVFDGDSGLVIRNTAPEGRVAVVFGLPTRAALDAAIAWRPEVELLCPPEEELFVREEFPDWVREGALLFELRDEGALVPADDRVRLLAPDDDLAHLAPELRAELEAARERYEVWCAFEAGTAASFAYAHWRTESLFDISIDTAPAFRRRGLARLAVSRLVRRERTAGRAPVWGAMEENAASRELAATLGFEQTDAVAILTAP